MNCLLAPPRLKCLVLLAPALTLSPAWSQVTTRDSLSSSGIQGNSLSYAPSLSAGGRYLVFISLASNLVASDTFGFDVFVRDRQHGVTELVSVSYAGGSSTGGCSLSSRAVSVDGRYTAFSSTSEAVVPGDLNGTSDVFVRDRQAGTAETMSVSSSGAAGNGFSDGAAISADGRYVVFASAASNLVFGDSNGFVDIFLRDRVAGTTERVSISSTGAQSNSNATQNATMSADGRFVVFDSDATNLLASPDANMSRDVFVRDRQAGTTSLVSVGLNGVSALGMSEYGWISEDGHFVAFHSAATNLVAGDVDGLTNTFVRDLQAGATEMASLATDGSPRHGVYPSMSANGGLVTFSTNQAGVVPEDSNGMVDVFVRDRTAGTTVRVSVSSSGVEGNGTSASGSVSPDGRYACFTSSAANLAPGDTNSFEDVFVRDGGPVLAGFCFGDGSGTPCPCGNSGAAGHGCENSSSTGGAILAATGTASLGSDTLVLTASGERPTVLTIVLQGDDPTGPLLFGDGLRCAGGTLKRLYAKSAVGGVVSAPQAGDAAVSVRSAALGDVISAGASRYYQTWYRDQSANFCPDPSGKNWNASSGFVVVWNY